MSEQTTPAPGSETPESPAPEETPGEKDLESRRRWGDHEPGWPAGTGPQAPPAEVEEKHTPGDRKPGGE